MIREITDLEAYTPKNDYSQFIKEYFLGIVRDGTKKYIHNVDVDISILEINGTLIPISVGNKKKENCFTVSLLGMFQYLGLEGEKIKNSFLRRFIMWFSHVSLVIIERYSLYRVIFVNNILLSTCLYPKIEKDDIQEIKEFISHKYSGYAIIFRSINDSQTQYLNDLESLGFKRIMFRQIYLSYKEKFSQYLKKRQIKWDRNFHKESGYTLKDCHEKQLGDVKKCYDTLYLEKYSYLNPQLSRHFFNIILRHSMFSIKILENDQKEVDAAYAYFVVAHQATAPVFGYKDKNLYRSLTYNCVFESLKDIDTMNWSAGVGKFKMLRGAEKTTEYFLIYYKELSFGKRFFWSIVYILSKYIGEPYLRKHVL